MPWQETSPVQQRERFIADHRRGLYSMTELCARYGISRKSGYKWLARFEEGGRAALQDRGRPRRFAGPEPGAPPLPASYSGRHGAADMCGPASPSQLGA